MPDPISPWGPLLVPVGAARRWRVGPWALGVRRAQGEWTFTAFPVGADPLATELEVAQEGEPADVPEDATVLRVTTAEDDPASLRPAGADRSMVVRPEVPLLLVDAVELYVSTPLWAQLEVDGVRVLDLPTWRPSDTFFGADPTDGVLAYAGRTTARREPQGLVPSPARVVTRVRIENRASTPLAVERIELPVPLLSLWSLPDGRLWTCDVVIERTADGLVRPPRYDAARAPGEGAVRAAEPRLVADPSFLHRAFGAILG